MESEGCKILGGEEVKDWGQVGWRGIGAERERDWRVGNDSVINGGSSSSPYIAHEVTWPSCPGLKPEPLPLLHHLTKPYMSELTKRAALPPTHMSCVFDFYQPTHTSRHHAKRLDSKLWKERLTDTIR